MPRSEKEKEVLKKLVNQEEKKLKIVDFRDSEGFKKER